MDSDQEGSEAGGVLSDNVVASNKVQERDGSYHVTIPKDSARDLGIKKGDNVLFTGEEGDDSLEVQKPERVLQQSED